MSQEKPSVLFIEADTSAKDSVTFQVSIQPEELKRRKCLLRLALFNDVTKQPLRIRDARFAEQGNQAGEVGRLVPVKFELFGMGSGKTLDIAFPYEAFEDVMAGSVLLVKAELLAHEAGEVLESTELPLLVTIAQGLAPYNAASMEKYLKGNLSPEQKIAYSISWLENRDDDKQIAMTCLKVLEELAGDTRRPQLQYRLYEFYLDQEKSYHSDQKAARWLGKATQGGYRPADKVAEGGGDAEISAGQPPAEDTIEKCIQSAQEGNSLAQWTLYEHYSRKDSPSLDPAKAFSYLKAAAENGNPAAVTILAEQYLEQQVYIQPEHIEEFLSILAKAAENRCAQADYQFFQVYYTGRCLDCPVPVDHALAFSHLKAAAENGLPDAGYALWELFENGNRFLMQTGDAVQWLVAASDGDQPQAQFRLGDLYVEGVLLPKDGARGVELIRHAAELGDREAQLTVYRMHLDGRYKDVLISQEVDKAHDLLFAYAEKGNPIAQKILWDSYVGGNTLMITVSEALSYLQRSVASQYEPAIFELANVYIDGRHTQQDLEKGRQLLEAAARYESAPAQFALYQFYGRGAYGPLECETLNQERAFKWLTLSARTMPEAQYEMWQLYRNGNEMRLGKREAIGMLFASAKQDYSPAVYHVGLLFGRGELLGKDSVKGISFIRSAVRLRNAEAMYTLSDILCGGSFEGEAVDRDEIEGHRLLILSAECGYLPACYRAWELFGRGRLEIEELWADRFLQEAVRGNYPPALRKLSGSDRAAPKSKSAPAIAEEPVGAPGEEAVPAQA